MATPYPGRTFRSLNHPAEWNDHLMLLNFHITRACFMSLIAMLEPSFERCKDSDFTLTIDIALGIFLHTVSSNAFYHSSATLFGTSVMCVHDSIHHVARHLERWLHRVIKFPSTAAERKRVSESVRSIAGFVNIR